jgi:hypothetical protein
MSIETMKLAFEALELCVEHGMFEQGSGVLHQSLDAITALRQAIKQAQKQEPVAHMYPCDLEEFKSREMCAYAYSIEYVSASKGETIPLYTSPPQHQPLSDEIPKGVLLAISNAGLTLIKTQHGYELRKLGPVIAHGIKGEA